MRSDFRFQPSSYWELENRLLPSYQSLPIIPDVSTLMHARVIADQGRAEGLNQNAFVKVGDSNSSSMTSFMFDLGNAVTTSGTEGFDPSILQTIQAYRTPIDSGGDNSFNRVSSAAAPGWTTVQTSATVVGEIEATHAAIALVMIGTNDQDVMSIDQYRANLEHLVDEITSLGTIPVLSTIPHMFFNSTSDATASALSQVIADVAAEKKIPLVNLNVALSSLSADGLIAGGVHLSVSPNGAGALGVANRQYGQNLREYILLQALTEIRQEVFSFNPTTQANSLPFMWTPLTAGESVIATASSEGNAPVVTVINAATGAVLDRILPYESTFIGGVRVAVGDVNGDGIPDLIVAPGDGGGPLIRVYSGADGSQIAQFFAFESSFRGGVSVAVGSVDGREELVVGAGASGGPRVRVFEGGTFAPIQDFFAFDPSTRVGVNVAVGSFGIAIGAGVGGAPEVRVFDGSGTWVNDFFAYNPGLRGGVTVAAGDLDGSGNDELVTGPGAGGAPEIVVFDPLTGKPLQSFFGNDVQDIGGTRVSVVRGNSPKIAIAPASAQPQPVRVFDPSGDLVLTPSDGASDNPFIAQGANIG